MTASEAKQIINDQINKWNVNHLIRIVSQRGTADCIEVKEKKITNPADEKVLTNFIASLKEHGLKYKGIGVGYDYNAKEYTMIFSYTELNILSHNL